MDGVMDKMRDGRKERMKDENTKGGGKDCTSNGRMDGRKNA